MKPNCDNCRFSSVKGAYLVCNLSDEMKRPEEWCVEHEYRANIIEIKMTPFGIYEKLRRQYLKGYKGHFRDMYEGHNHAERMATRYAIKNTIPEWRRQYGAT